jgi:hypothetical protein
LVVHADSSKRSALLLAEAQLEQVGAMIHGCVLTNVVVGRNHGYGYGYAYTYAPEQPENRRRIGASRRSRSRPSPSRGAEGSAASGRGRDIKGHLRISPEPPEPQAGGNGKTGDVTTIRERGDAADFPAPKPGASDPAKGRPA